VIEEIDAAQRWWDDVQADLRLRRGQSGLYLLEVIRYDGASPYRLCKSVERLIEILKEHITSGSAPKWADSLVKEAKGRRRVLQFVPPLPSEVDSGRGLQD
jgi:hypothetical protein